MQRRVFLQLPFAVPLGVSAPEPQGRAAGHIRVAAGEDRFGQHSFKLDAATIDNKVSEKDTRGALCVFEAVRVDKGGPPLHVHRKQDEWFYIIEGEYAFRVGDETFRLGAGESLFAPRGIPHTFAKISDGPGKMILAYQPAGSMEQYFRDVTAFTRPPTEAETRQLFKRHDMEVVGPPLPTAL